MRWPPTISGDGTAGGGRLTCNENIQVGWNPTSSTNSPGWIWSGDRARLKSAIVRSLRIPGTMVRVAEWLQAAGCEPVYESSILSAYPNFMKQPS